MLDHIDEPAVPVGAEYFGRARDFRRRVQREDTQFIATIGGLIEPIKQRLHKYPTRKLRPEMLAALVQSWRFVDYRDFRLDLNARLERTRCVLVERRVVAGEMRFLDEDRVGDEPDVAVSEIGLMIDGNRFVLRGMIICALSMHAIARRLQRGQDGSDAALLHDMNIAANIDHSKLSGGGFKVTTDEHGGGWRGRMVRMVGDDGDPLPVLSIRTWLQ